MNDILITITNRFIASYAKDPPESIIKLAALRLKSLDGSAASSPGRYSGAWSFDLADDWTLNCAHDREGSWLGDGDGEKDNVFCARGS